MRNAIRLLAALPILLAASAGRTEVEIPTAVDNRLAIELFAAEPDLVTPTGIAVDARGRVLVIESHTHFRPEGYTGPAADRIRMFEDTDGDGKADRITTFFEGSEFTMNVACHHDGSIYVATRNEIFRLRDTDDDGDADERTSIAKLKTAGNYPHNGLSGFAFDLWGEVYFGLGENLGESYKLIGSDGTTLSGGGEGGNIYRCTPDGGGVVRVATGFWNPFHLCFDAFGRLFAVDNDADSRPPCRLLHIVQDGDYGYRFRNGRKGLHPFTAWNGELPGTLPMVAGTGEAPSGIIAYESDNLPDDYRGDLLCTSWGDHRIERYRLIEHGASFRSTLEPVISGGENFRPVGIALAPDGTLYVSDWVDKSYQLHGKGRIWRIRSARRKGEYPHSEDPQSAITSPHRPRREAAARTLAGSKEGRANLKSWLTYDLREIGEPRVRAVAIMALQGPRLALRGRVGPDALESLSRAATRDSSSAVRAVAVRAIAQRYGVNHIPDICSSDPSPAVRAEALLDRPRRKALVDSDPFIHHAAMRGLHRARPSGLAELAKSPDAGLRLTYLLWARAADPAKVPGGRLLELPSLLADPDPEARFTAVQWVAEENLAEFRPQLLENLGAQNTTRRLFEGTLAALAALDGEPRGPLDELGAEQYVARLVGETGTVPGVRRRALRMLRPDHPALTPEALTELAGAADEPLRLEAIRTLRESPHPQARELLAAAAGAPDSPPQIRAEAVVGLSADSGPAVRELLWSLVDGADPVLRDEALRSMRGAELSADERERLVDLRKRAPDTADLIDRVLDPAAPPKSPPANLNGWLVLLEGPADAAAGERIFFHSKVAACHRCHQVEGRGGRIGPDLTVTRIAQDRRRLVESIVLPSKEIAPMFVPWAIETVDGRALTGLLLSEGLLGEQTYVDPKGETFMLKPPEIAARAPHDKSLMPESLAQALTIQEFRDLLAYLEAKR